MSSTTFNYTIQMRRRPVTSYVPKGEDSDGLGKPEDVRGKAIFENLPPPIRVMSISIGAVEESLEDAFAILEDDFSEREVVDVAEDEEQQRRRRPLGSDAYRRELLQDNGMKLIEEAMATLDMDDLSSLCSSDEEISYASDEDDLDVFF